MLDHHSRIGWSQGVRMRERDAYGKGRRNASGRRFFLKKRRITDLERFVDDDNERVETNLL